MSKNRYSFTLSDSLLPVELLCLPAIHSKLFSAGITTPPNALSVSPHLPSFMLSSVEKDEVVGSNSQFMEAKLTKIPLPGGSGAVPSGALQFQDDWPGLFLRGDEAVVFGSRIRLLLAVLKEKKVDDARIESALLQLEEVAEIIDRLVRVR